MIMPETAADLAILAVERVMEIEPALSAWEVTAGARGSLAGTPTCDGAATSR